MQNKLTVACVLRTYPQETLNSQKIKLYSSDDVLRLKKSFKKYLTIDHDFICLTNEEFIPGVKTINLIGDTPTWWSKIELFRPDLGIRGPVLYIDLDMIIVQNIDDLVNQFFDQKFLMMSSRNHIDESTSCLMYWDGDFSYLWDQYCKDPQAVRSKYKKKPKFGDQAFIQENVTHQRITSLPGVNPDWFVYIEPQTEINEKVKIFIFEGMGNKPWSPEYTNNKIITQWKNL